MTHLMSDDDSDSIEGYTELSIPPPSSILQQILISRIDPDPTDPPEATPGAVLWVTISTQSDIGGGELVEIVSAASIYVPMSMVRAMIEGLEGVRDNTLKEKYEEWFDAGIEEMLDSGEGDKDG